MKAWHDWHDGMQTNLSINVIKNQRRNPKTPKLVGKLIQSFDSRTKIKLIDQLRISINSYFASILFGNIQSARIAKIWSGIGRLWLLYKIPTKLAQFLLFFSYTRIAWLSLVPAIGKETSWKGSTRRNKAIYATTTLLTSWMSGRPIQRTRLR